MALSAEKIQAIFETHGRRANRALGQNFCVNEEKLHAAALAAAPMGTVVEIGPGLGALTEELLAVSERVIAVEKDAFLAGLLPELCPNPRLNVIGGDILRADIPSLTENGPFSAAGNLPYYITTPILEKILPLLPDVCLFMVQKEAAVRFFAKPGDRVYGPVAVLADVYYRPQKLFDLSAADYYPQPEVDSSVVLLRKKAETDGLPAPAELVRFVSRALAMRRKTIANNFAKDARLTDALGQCGIPSGIRAETLAPADFVRLFQAYAEAAGTPEV